MTTKLNTLDRIEEMHIMESELDVRSSKYKGVPRTTKDVYNEATLFYESYTPRSH